MSVVVVPFAVDLIPEAHASHPTRLTVLSTIGGVAFIWLVVGLAS